MDRLLAAREDFKENLPCFADLAFESKNITVTGTSIEYNAATLAQASPEEAALVKHLNWPSPDPKLPHMYMVTFHNYMMEIFHYDLTPKSATGKQSSAPCTGMIV